MSVVLPASGTINKIVVDDLNELHNRLLQSSRFPFYNAEYYKVLPFIVELRNKGEKDINEIETCLNALYGTMMLRLQGKTITPNTEHAIKEISTFLGMLSDYHIKDKTATQRYHAVSRCPSSLTWQSFVSCCS